MKFLITFIDLICFVFLILPAPTLAYTYVYYSPTLLDYLYEYRYQIIIIIAALISLCITCCARMYQIRQRKQIRNGQMPGFMNGAALFTPSQAFRSTPGVNPGYPTQIIVTTTGLSQPDYAMSATSMPPKVD